MSEEKGFILTVSKGVWQQAVMRLVYPTKSLRNAPSPVIILYPELIHRF